VRNRSERNGTGKHVIQIELTGVLMVALSDSESELKPSVHIYIESFSHRIRMSVYFFNSLTLPSCKAVKSEFMNTFYFGLDLPVLVWYVLPFVGYYMFQRAPFLSHR
jgi:hypothetical protein